MKRFLRDHTAVAALLTGAVLASACVSPDDPGISIEARSANLVFGVKLPEETSPVPAQLGAPTAARRAAPPSIPQPTFRGVDVPFFETPPPVEDPCPPAPNDATPKELTEAEVTGPPRTGVFKWRVNQRDFDAQAREWKAFRELPFERRAVRRFETIDDQKFRYQVVQPIPGSEHFLLSTYQVDSGADSVDQPAGEGVVQLPRGREPEAGLVLKATEVRDAKGNRVTDVHPFQPSTGVLMLPLPVVSGEHVESVAVDPRTGMTVFHSFNVLARERVEACGVVTDGWAVESVQTVVVGNQQTRVEYDYIVATQFGAMIIAENVTPFVGDSAGDTDAHPLYQRIQSIGQLEGDPLPPELE